MVPDTNVPTRSGPTQMDDFVFWDPCTGLQPLVVAEPRTFLIGQAIVAAISLGVLGLLGFLLPSD